MAKAFIIMPGGFGTLDELMEVLTLIQTYKIRKKCALVLYGKSFWEKVINLDALVEAGTISPEDLDLFHATDSVDDAYDYLTHWFRENILVEPDENAAKGSS